MENLFKARINKISLHRTILLFLLLVLILLPTLRAHATESGETDRHKEWRVTVGGGLMIAPAFAGAKSYSLLAVPDLRIAYKDQFFANVRDGIGYVLINKNGWRVGPVVSYSFRRSEKDSGSIFRIAGGNKDALQGMGDVPGTVSLGGFVEYALKPYTFKLHLHKGVTGHEGMFAEGRISYGGVITCAGPLVIYSVGPHIKFGDRAYTNAYWGVTPEQSLRSGLEPYRAGAGVSAYGVSAFALKSLTTSVSISAVAGFDRLAPTVANSPLIQVRGSENQAMGGVFVNYEF